MLSWFPSMGANKAFLRLMRAVLAWLCACHSGLGALRQVSGAMHCYGCCVPMSKNITILPYPPHLCCLRTPEPSRSESLCGCVLQTHGGHKTETDVLFFKAMTIYTLVQLSSPSAKYLVLRPNRSEIYLRQLPKTVFCFEDLWRTSAE